MTNYVLVHGGNHAGWCWELMIPHLREDPRTGEVLALDLVGHGSRKNDKPHGQIIMEDYINDIADAILKRDLREVVIVGHSMAGSIIPQAAALVPDRVKGLVFISAVIPQEGKSVQETWNEIGFSFDSDSSDLKSYYRRIFCQDMDETTIQWFLSKVDKEPPGGFTAPVYRSVLPRSISNIYVLLTRDQVLPLEAQRSLAGNIEHVQFAELESGHNAMISHPKELAKLLLRYA